MSSNKNIEIGLAFFIWKCENTSNGSNNGLESNGSLKLGEKVGWILIRTCHMELKTFWQKMR